MISLFFRAQNDALSSTDNKVNNLLLYKDITGTTSATGNLTLDLSASSYMVIGLRVGSANGGIATAWNQGGVWWARIVGADGNAKGNQQFTVRVEYKTLSS